MEGERKEKRRRKEEKVEDEASYERMKGTINKVGHNNKVHNIHK